MKIRNINKIDAIIFDFDGVIFDTEPLWFKASIITLKKLNKQFDNSVTFKNTIGVQSDKVFEMLLNKKLDSSELKKINKIYRNESKKIFKRKLKPFAFLRSFLKMTNAKLAIVSNSDYKFINKLLKNSDLNKYFKKSNIISCNKILKPKPNPDGYIYAINKLKLKKNNTLIIEDSENGISAAKKSGVKNIFRFTNYNNNLSNKIKHTKIKNIKTYKEFLNLK